jgi:transcriptional repressor NrdR
VVDSRTAQDGAAIRRRRLCSSCQYRFTTFERMEEAPLVVTKRSGQRVPFDRAKIISGVRAAAKGRPVTEEELENLAIDVEDAMRLDGPEVTSAHIGVAVLDALRHLDEVAYLRFASVYKGFDDAADFERELTLLAKGTAPKQH